MKHNLHLSQKWQKWPPPGFWPHSWESSRATYGWFWPGVPHIWRWTLMTTDDHEATQTKHTVCLVSIGKTYMVTCIGQNIHGVLYMTKRMVSCIGQNIHGVVWENKTW